MEITKEFGENLRRHREGMNLSAEALGDLTNVSSKHIYDVEKGRKKPSFELIIEAAKALDVEVGDLFKNSYTVKPKAVPVSKTLQLMMNIPDDIYEKAQAFGVGHDVWDEVRASFADAQKDIDGKNKSSLKHS